MKVPQRRVTGFRKTAIARYAQANLVRGSELVSDGLYCFAGVTAAHRRHLLLITGSGRQAAQHPAFKWVNTLLGSVNNALPGTFPAIREQHVPRYLAEFEDRFNRRFDLPAMIASG